MKSGSRGPGNWGPLSMGSRWGEFEWPVDDEPYDIRGHTTATFSLCSNHSACPRVLLTPVSVTMTPHLVQCC